MDIDQINVYLESAREIIGERSKAEIDYDDAIVSHLDSGKNIQQAINAASKLYPDEALGVDSSLLSDLQNRYEYISEHKKILKKLGIQK